MKKIISVSIFLFFFTNTCFCSDEVAKVSWTMHGCKFIKSKNKNICQEKSKTKSSGSSVYLGNGLFVTAAHVIDYQRFERYSFHYKVPAIKIEFWGQIFDISEIPVKSTLLPFDVYDPSYGDIAILKSSFAANKHLKIHRLCKKPEIPGSYGVISTIHGVKNIRFLARQDKLGAYDMVSPAGDSGGGVFQSSGCLAGIISRQYPGDDPRMTLFTPYELTNKGIEEATKIYKTNTNISH